MNARLEKGSIPDELVYGFAISVIGGPLALAAINIFGGGVGSLSIETLIGAILFLFPVAIWYGYSKKIASAGGLYSFVKQAAGEKIAKIQGIIFIFSYFLYIPYTITFIVYYLAPVVFPGITPYQPFLEILLPIAVIALLFSGMRSALSFLTASAIVQIVLIIGMATLLFANVNPSLPAAFSSSPGLLHNSIAISLSFICLSLLPFIGGEAKGGSKVIQKAFLLAFGVTAILLIIIAIPISQLPGSLQQSYSNSEIPGVNIVDYYSGTFYATIIGIFAIISTAGLIVAEFIAVGRVLYVMVKPDIRKINLILAGLFIIADFISIANPKAFYNDLIIPSIIALYISQLIVFVVYPLYAKKGSKISIPTISIAAVASILALAGLYIVITGLASS